MHDYPLAFGHSFGAGLPTPPDFLTEGLQQVGRPSVVLTAGSGDPRRTVSCLRLNRRFARRTLRGNWTIGLNLDRLRALLAQGQGLRALGAGDGGVDAHWAAGLERQAGLQRGSLIGGG